MEANQTASGRGSRATGAPPTATREKAFACTHPGCTKRFTRAEHLQRHALNHVPGGGAACPLCQAHFKRPDLLNRHMERHQQKDIEAGGPGYGVLDTRKRAWQAPDGTIKDTNPRSRASARLRKETQSSRESSQSSQQQEQGFQQQQGSNHRQPLQQLQQQPSPESEENDTCSNPVDERHNISWDSANSLEDNTHDLRHGFAAGLGGAFGHNPSWSRGSLDHQEDHSRNQLDFTFTNSGPGLSSTTPPIYDELNYDQIFQPDTASSFNMPYTTALDYDWLLSGAKQAPSIPIHQQHMAGNNQHTGQNHQAFDISPPSTSSQLWSLPSDSGFGDASVVSLGGNRCAPGQGSPGETDLSAAFTLVQDLPMMPHSNIDPMLGSSGPPSNRQPVRTQIRRKQQPQQRQQQPQQQQQQQQSYTSEAQRIHIPERPFSTLQGTINVPEIDHETRNIILGVIDSSGPSLPNGHDTPLSQLPLLSIESLQEYLELFFTRFNTSYPLIHLPTFSPSKTEPLLLISILVLGATYSTKDAHQVAVCIHDVIRPLIFAHAGFSAKPQMWSLQTILLVECFGKSRAGLKQHEMSHLFHGLLINLIRRSDCQSVKPQGPGVRARQDTNEDTAWHQWAAQEERKRLALFCFMWDTQHAVLFCQSLCMSSFELRVDLPCPQAIWEAPDSTSWSSAWRDTPSAAREIPYLLALKSYLSPTTARPFILDAMSRVLVLHGLMSVAWDMQRRDQTSLGMNPINNTESQVDWKKVIGGAYDAWQRDFDVHCATAVAHMRSNSIERSNSNTQQNTPLSSDELRARCDALWSFSASYSTLAGCAQILLNMDFLDVQVYAGARQILGRPVQQRDYIRSAAVVKKWAAVTKPTTGTSTPTLGNPGFTTNDQGKHSATIAATHAALNLHRHMDYLTSQDAMSLFHVPWCIYLLTLTLWSSQHARSIDPPSSHGSHLDSFAMDEDDEMVWDAHAEMQGLLLSLIENDGAPPRSGAAKRRTNGLVWIMTETLTKVRWGIIHGAVSVLKGLVPQRLIHRYNEEPMDSKDFGV